MTDNHRPAFITGLRALADYLDVNPAVPVPRHSHTVRYFPRHGSDADMCAEIDQIAAALGCDTNTESAAHGHYSTAIRFGPIEYQATAIVARARARHAAESSYFGCVQPDPIPAP